MAGDRIAAAFMEGMAAAEATQAQSDTAYYTVDFNRFLHVGGTARIKPAGRGQERRDQALIPGEEEDGGALAGPESEAELSRRNRRFTSA